MQGEVWLVAINKWRLDIREFLEALLYLPHEILAPGEKYLDCDLCFSLVVCEDNHPIFYNRERSVLLGHTKHICIVLWGS